MNTIFALGGVLFIAFSLFKYLLEWETFSNIFYWIMLFFAPFSLIDCFRKIAFGTFQELLPVGEKTPPGEFEEIKEFKSNVLHRRSRLPFWNLWR